MAEDDEGRQGQLGAARIEAEDQVGADAGGLAHADG
jgi:hypothetical protein